MNAILKHGQVLAALQAFCSGLLDHGLAGDGVYHLKNPGQLVAADAWPHALGGWVLHSQHQVDAGFVRQTANTGYRFT